LASVFILRPEGIINDKLISRSQQIKRFFFGNAEFSVYSQVLIAGWKKVSAQFQIIYFAFMQHNIIHNFLASRRIFYDCKHASVIK
jgi:hypothetical protein